LQNEKWGNQKHISLGWRFHLGYATAPVGSCFKMKNSAFPAIQLELKKAARVGF
jgi:hypothetical protein